MSATKQVMRGRVMMGSPFLLPSTAHVELQANHDHVSVGAASRRTSRQSALLARGPPLDCTDRLFRRQLDTGITIVKPLRQYGKRRRVALLFERFHCFRSYQ